jgi:mRNA interferase MazF
MVVKRGEIYWVNWGEGEASEQSGTHPALIIQNDIGNLHSPNTTVIAWLTTAPNKPFPFIVNVSAAESGMSQDGAVDLAFIATIGKHRLGGKCGTINANKMQEIEQALKISLGLK